MYLTIEPINAVMDDKRWVYFEYNHQYADAFKTKILLKIVIGIF